MILVINFFYFPIVFSEPNPEDDTLNNELGDSKITGGEKTYIENHPYMVQLKKNGKFFCGGSIIEQNLVLTAAHCLYELDVDTNVFKKN